MSSTASSASPASTRPAAGLLLDVDGTLLDSNYVHTVAWSRGFNDVGAWAPMHAIHRLVGMGGDRLVRELLGDDRPGAEEAWRTRFDEMYADVRAFPGAVELVRRIVDAGLAVVLATSSPADLLDRAVELLGIGADITAMTSSGDVPSAKPDPAVFEAAIERAQLDRDFVLAVGDSVWDVQAARAAGIGCIGLEAGGFSRHELEEEGAIAVYRDVAELSAQLMTSPVAALIGRR